MKRKIYLCIIMLIAVHTLGAQSGRIGIGTNNPLARLHVADSSVLFSAVGEVTVPYLPVPISGQGRRLLWYVDKAAFMFGYDQDNNWIADSIGFYSFAGGRNTRASGYASFAMGMNSMATRAEAIAIGDNTQAHGPYSLATGSYTIALGTASTATGELTIARGSDAFATGLSTEAVGMASFASGGASRAYGNLSVATNFSTSSYGTSSSAAGNATIANGKYSFVVGSLNDTLVTKDYEGYNNPLFIVGNGDDYQGINRSNALVVYKSGNTDHNGYTRLGQESEGAPAIKVKEISGAVSAASEGGTIIVPHGLIRSNIIALNALLVYGSGDVIPGFRGTPGYEFSIAYDDVNIYIYNIAGNSASILSKPVKISIIYKNF